MSELVTMGTVHHDEVRLVIGIDYGTTFTGMLTMLFMEDPLTFDRCGLRNPELRLHQSRANRCDPELG